MNRGPMYRGSPAPYATTAAVRVAVDALNGSAWTDGDREVFFGIIHEAGQWLPVARKAGGTPLAVAAALSIMVGGILGGTDAPDARADLLAKLAEVMWLAAEDRRHYQDRALAREAADAGRLS